MTWFTRNERQTAALGIEKMVWPWRFSDHGAINSASVFDTSAARVAATWRSNRASNSVRDLTGEAGGVLPISISDWFSVTSPQLARLARWVASPPSDIDLAW